MQFLTKVRFTYTLHRKSKGDGYRYWTPDFTYRYNSDTKTNDVVEFTGYIIGKRILQNGKWGYEYTPRRVNWEDYEESYEWQPQSEIERFTAYLIAINMKENPVYVLPEHLEALGD